MVDESGDAVMREKGIGVVIKSSVWVVVDAVHTAVAIASMGSTSVRRRLVVAVEDTDNPGPYSAIVSAGYSTRPEQGTGSSTSVDIPCCESVIEKLSESFL
ncbi:hypothetical protein RhiLY_09179 [Ceratobasidium sp. AG-Ba]|nr:hypothetical protein RhiLY_09179 [Ceratobasidium sp. AG-Ba]